MLCRRIYLPPALLIVAMLIQVGCAKETGANPSRKPDTGYNPVLAASGFLAEGDIKNPFIAHPYDKTYVYTGRGEEGDEYIEVTHSTDSATVLGIRCSVIVEEIQTDGYVIERENKYCAEDADGNVWILAIQVENFSSSGHVINNHTSWTSGVHDARPGMMFPGKPTVGTKYRTEYYFNVAEDQAEITETGVTVTTTLGTFHDCVVLHEWSELEPGNLEYKVYAPGVGLIKEINLTTGDEIELIDIR